MVLIEHKRKWHVNDDLYRGYQCLSNQRTLTTGDRADYARLASAEAQRLWAIADVLDEFEFNELARQVRLQASDYTDMATRARTSLGVNALLM